LYIYIAPLSDADALPTQVSALTRKQDSLQAFPKKRKRKGEELKAQLLREITPAGGANKSEASGWSGSTVQERNNPKTSGSRAERRDWDE